MKKTGTMFIKNLHYLCLVGVIALGLMTIVGTGGDGGGGGTATTTDTTTDTTTTPPTATLTDSAGNEVSSIPEGGVALLALSDLKASTQYDIWVNEGSSDESYFRLTSDADGNIPPTAIGYDLAEGSYSYTVEEVTTSSASSTRADRSLESSYTVAAPTRKLDIKDSTDSVARSFQPGSSVYVTGTGFTASTEVDIYVVNDQISWSDGDQLRDVSASFTEETTPAETLSPHGRSVDMLGTAERVTTDSDGTIASTRLWEIPSSGISGGSSLDVVVDIDKDGLFDAATDYVNDHFGVGFVIQESQASLSRKRAAGSDFNAQLACDANANYKGTFLTTDSVYVYVMPETRMQVGQHRWVYKYVVAHKDSWTDGDTLTDVSGPSNPWEADTVQYGCTNEYRVLVWPATLTAGEYDVIIDVDRDGVYDEGTDILDGTSQVPGFVVVEPQTQKKWTVMVYINGDNNLESAGIVDINEMEEVGSTDDVNIVVQFDRITGYAVTDPDWVTARRYYIEQDADTTTIGSTMIEDIGEVDMGSSQTLTDFAAWAIANYPAEHYLLVVWDHGGGWRKRTLRGLAKNISWDDTSGGTSISIPELAEVAQTVKTYLGTNLDILGLDACLMAMLEVAYEVRGSVDYVVASEELEPGNGWPYDDFLARLVAAPTSTPEQLSKWIVQDYITFYTGSQEVTQSAVDSSKVGTLASKVDSFAQALIAGIADTTDGATIKAALQTIRGNTQYFDYGGTSYNDMRDLYHFAHLVSQDSSMTTAITTAAAEVKTAVTAAVVENGTVGSTMANANGLSIWLPDGTYFTNYIQRYGQVGLAGNTKWDEFLAELWGVKMRIQLTWGQNPSDLDSHLWDIFGNHIYYAAKTAISGAWLDLDDVTSYGPENIRIEYFNQPDGNTYDTYLYAVYLYYGSDSTETVTVKVFLEGNTVPTKVYTKAGFANANRWWQVFSINPTTEVITDIDTTQSSSPRSLGERGMPDKDEMNLEK